MEMRTKDLSEDGTSKIVWKLYAPDVSQETIEEDFPEQRINSAYDCTGRWFAHPASVRRTKTRTLVTQFRGMDI